jgi:hypothetical protein
MPLNQAQRKRGSLVSDLVRLAPLSRIKRGADILQDVMWDVTYKNTGRTVEIARDIQPSDIS